jgi:excinuclease ABC subunit C
MSLDDKLSRLPDRPGVYLYRDAKAQVIYVGKAASLKSRVRSYFQESRAPDPKTDALVRQIADLEYIVTDNELEAMMLEANLVRKHRPRYNIILRDDKHYPFLRLTTDEDFPRLLVARRVRNDGSTYFGPFYPATAMRETLRLTRQLFPLRTCSITIDGRLERPCIQYAIHRLQRAVHRLGDPGGVRADRARREALPGGQGRRPGPSAHRRDGDCGRRGEVRAGRGAARPDPVAEQGA